MKKKIINQAGNWSAWPDEKRSALIQGKDNRQIGQKIAFENEDFRVWTIHLPSMQSLPFHRHSRRYLWTCLSVGESRSFYDDGIITETKYEPGDTTYFNDLSEDKYFIHNLENIGDTTLIFSAVEFLH